MSTEAELRRQNERLELLLNLTSRITSSLNLREVLRAIAANTYVEVYWLLAVIAAVMFLGSFLLKRNEPGKGGHVAVH